MAGRVAVQAGATALQKSQGGSGILISGAEGMAPAKVLVLGAGVAGIFMETHPKPEEALCDGPNSLPLSEIGDLLETLVALDSLVKGRPLLESRLAR